MKKETIIKLMNDEVYNYSSHYNAIYFQPKTGKFLYADTYINNEIVNNLINDKTITYIGNCIHQSEKMLKYISI